MSESFDFFPSQDNLDSQLPQRMPTADQVEEARHWLEKHGEAGDSSDAYDLAARGDLPKESMSDYGFVKLEGEPDYFFDN